MITITFQPQQLQQIVDILAKEPFKDISGTIGFILEEARKQQQQQPPTTEGTDA